MMEKNFIPKKQLRHLPFLYKHIKVIDEKFPLHDTQPIKLTGKITTIQNENAVLLTFYKCISRF